MADPLQESLDRQMQLSQPGSSSGSGGGFIQSAVSSMTRELIGLDAPASVERWRARNPAAGLASQIVGFGVPYVGWLKASSKLTRFDAFVRGLGESAGPVGRAALQSTTRMAPFEAGRIGLSVLAGGDVGSTALDAAINLGLEGVLGGVGGALRSFGRAETGRTFTAAGIGPDDSWQIRARKLQERIRVLESPVAGAAVDATKVAEEVGRTREALFNVQKAIREQTPLRGTPTKPEYTSGRLEIGNPESLVPAAQAGLAAAFNRWFHLPKGRAETGENAVKGLMTDDAFKELGGIDTVLPHMQYPRELTLRGDRLRKFHQTITGRLQQVDDLGWIGKEAEEGLWIVVKKLPSLPSPVLPPGAAIKADAERFAMFKTDNPGLFFPKKDLWTKNVELRSFDQGAVDGLADTGSELVTSLKNFMGTATFGLIGGMPQGMIGRMAKKLGIDKVRDHEAYDRLAQIANRSILPAVFEFGKNLRARRAWAAMREVFSEGQEISNKMLFGAKTLQAGKGAMSIILGRGTNQGGIIQLIEAAGEGFRQDLLKATDFFGEIYAKYQKELKAGTTLDENMVIDKLVGLSDANKRISAESGLILKELVKLDKELSRLTKATEQAVGVETGFKPLFGHMLVSRTWEGDWRAAIFDQRGNKVWITGAHNRGDAQRRAQAMIDELTKKGQSGLRVGQAWHGDRASDFKESLSIRSDMPEYRQLAEADRLLQKPASRPVTMRKARSGHGKDRRMPGAITDRVLTKKELSDIIKEHVERRLNYLSELTVKKGLYGELDKLKLEDPGLLDQLLKRLDDLSGKQSPMSRNINNAADALLSPWLGPNSASKIVHTANRLIFNLELGMGNIMFPVVNALTFIQTTMPHIAYVLKAHPNMLQQYYSHVPAMGTDGLIRGSVGVLQPFRIVANGFKHMRDMHKNPEFLALTERGINGRMLEPKFVEGWMGQDASRLQRLRNVGKEGNYIEIMEAVSTMVPGMSERFSRVHTWGIAYDLAKNVLGMTDPDRMYRFMKEFTENTMFAYSASDRARIITGPLGTFFGMFKNWQMHYMGWMMTYAREGMLRGNWAPLLWQTAGTWSVAGVKGTPFYGMAEAFSEWATDSSMLENIYNWFGPADRDPALLGGDSGIADAIYMGLPGLLGASLTGSTAAPFADPVRDASMLMNFVHWDRMKALGQAVGSGIESWATTGNHPIQDDATRRQFLRALSPRAVYRAMSVIEGDMIQSTQTGYPSINGLSLGERFMYGLGFNPRWIALQFDAQRELWANQESLRSGIAFYGEQIANAQAAGDWREVTNLSQMAMLRGVPMDSVWRSINSRTAKMEEDTIERQFSPSETGPLRSAGLVQ